jgi:hypothetical protein
MGHISRFKTSADLRYPTTDCRLASAQNALADEAVHPRGLYSREFSQEHSIAFACGARTACTRKSQTVRVALRPCFLISSLLALFRAHSFCLLLRKGRFQGVSRLNFQVFFDSLSHEKSSTTQEKTISSSLFLSADRLPASICLVALA